MIGSPEELTERLTAVGYLPGDDLALALFLALKLGRPLLLEGDPGVGKTDLARKLAQALHLNYFRLQCYAGLDASQALYEWNFQQQILALRADRREEPYDPKFLLRRPILRALQEGPAVLLIDEIDRADDEFEALLLQVLDEYEITVPELDAPIVAEVPPVVLLTSNRTRDVCDATSRRCNYHWISHPEPAEEERILLLRVGQLSQRLAREIAEGMQRVRQDPKVTRVPGVAETLEFASALVLRAYDRLDETAVRATISTVAKNTEDRERIVRGLLP